MKFQIKFNCAQFQKLRNWLSFLVWAVHSLCALISWAQSIWTPYCIVYLRLELELLAENCTIPRRSAKMVNKSSNCVTLAIATISNRFESTFNCLNSKIYTKSLIWTHICDRMKLSTLRHLISPWIFRFDSNVFVSVVVINILVFFFVCKYCNPSKVSAILACDLNSTNVQLVLWLCVVVVVLPILNIWCSIANQNLNLNHLHLKSIWIDLFVQKGHCKDIFA